MGATMITNFVLKIHPLSFVLLGLVDENGNVNHQRFAKVMWRIAEMCKDEWWETNDIANPPQEGNDCFYFDITNMLNGKVIYAEAVPGERPNIYLWIREEPETRNDEEMLSFQHPDETRVMEKMPKEMPSPSKN